MSKISVVVPVYNVEKYIKRCISSILNQSFQDFELILIDDGSTDGSLTVCKEYEDDKRVKIFHQNNQGLSGARNAGILKASSEYIFFVDSDDWINKECLQILYQIISEYDADIVQFDYWATRFEPMNLPMLNKRMIRVLTGKDAVHESCQYPGAVKYNIAWNKLYKRCLFENIQFPKGRVHEDEYTSYRLLWAAKCVVDISDRLYYYFQRDDSITGNISINKCFDRYGAFEQKIKDLQDWQMDAEKKIVERGYYFKLKEDLSKYDAIKETYEYGSLVRKYNEVQQKIVSCYGEEITKPYLAGKCYSYPNAKDEFGNGKRIALYGAGNVGKDYYRQLHELAEIVTWVDHRWYYLRRDGLMVDCVDSLLVTDYDYVLVAVEKENAAEEIIQDLINLGIDRQKIIWMQPVMRLKRD